MCGSGVEAERREVVEAERRAEVEPLGVEVRLRTPAARRHAEVERLQRRPLGAVRLPGAARLLEHLQPALLPRHHAGAEVVAEACS